ncbi:hypothetical protein [Prochlorococcus sp. MIT 1300]|uniref:hypothetical protein n=1 Tax=Prochlorococcus sp. MIT 1300 TaxID=3096218 RepID=UPI002A74908D|nr:hypothetical protein [Prochlorococcus sp. MIT 1300]
MTDKKNIRFNKAKSCLIPRKQEAIEALLGLAWLKCRKDRPIWVVNDLHSYLEGSNTS